MKYLLLLSLLGLASIVATAQTRFDRTYDLGQAEGFTQAVAALEPGTAWLVAYSEKIVDTSNPLEIGVSHVSRFIRVNTFTGDTLVNKVCVRGSSWEAIAAAPHGGFVQCNATYYSTMQSQEFWLYRFDSLANLIDSLYLGAFCKAQSSPDLIARLPNGWVLAGLRPTGNCQGRTMSFRIVNDSMQITYSKSSASIENLQELAPFQAGFAVLYQTYFPAWHDIVATFSAQADSLWPSQIVPPTYCRQTNNCDRRFIPLSQNRLGLLNYQNNSVTLFTPSTGAMASKTIVGTSLKWVTHIYPLTGDTLGFAGVSNQGYAIGGRQALNSAYETEEVLYPAQDGSGQALPITDGLGNVVLVSITNGRDSSIFQGANPNDFRTRGDLRITRPGRQFSLGTIGVENQVGFSLYPNPVAANSTVHMAGLTNTPTTQASLCDLLGRHLATIKLQNGLLTLPNLPPGVYQLHIGEQSTKVIVK